MGSSLCIRDRIHITLESQRRGPHDQYGEEMGRKPQSRS